MIAGAELIGFHEDPREDRLATDLQQALERGDLRVHYLPLVCLEDGRVEGVEALVRWQRGSELLDAGRFLSLAERTGLIVPIGGWAMGVACRDIAEWNRSHPDRLPLRISVNLSLEQLTARDAIEQIRSTLEASGLDAKQLCLEIREDSLSHLGATVGPTLIGLKELGIRLSIDDFGTGASSLLALQRYQLDELKIERSFVAEMDQHGDAAAIVRGVVRLAESLGLDVVATGVERPAQERMLRQLGCMAAQGWLYAHPAGDLSAVVAAADASLTDALVRSSDRSDTPASSYGTAADPLAAAGVPHAANAERDAESSLRRAHATLAMRATELAEANERLQSFASTVSHDLMQPVAVLSGFLSLLDRALPDLDPEHRTWLEGALRGKDRLIQAIDALHRHAAADDIPLVAVDLGGLVQELAPGLLADLGEAALDARALPVVAGDAGLITQVIANLVQNAGRYRHPERPLAVTIRARHDDGSWLVTVTDTGKGIAPGELESVFTPGTRGSAAEGTTGTGRGLATVRSLMTRMRGEAWAEQPEGPGAKICLRFGVAAS